MKHVLDTDRLTLREIILEDAEFIFELMNSPGWIKHIGDRGIKSLKDAKAYLKSRIMASYSNHGFGLYHTSITETGEPIGICGLVKRDSLEDPDIGFAFLERYTGRGYAYESAKSVLDYAKNILAIPKVVAITSPANTNSQKVLEKIGLQHVETIQIPDYEDENFYYE